MKFPLPLLYAGVRGRTAFTLIELLAVMAIILVLAGLILNIAGSAQYNSAKARATGEIKALETALESYKADNGAYPPDPNTPANPSESVSALLNAQKDFSPTDIKYLRNSEYLYQVLSGFPVNVQGTPMVNTTPTAMTKPYITFKIDQIETANKFDSTAPTVKTTTSPYMYIVHPFGFSYGYSTIYAATVAYNTATNTTTPVTTAGYNPTFDLWSTAGYASGAKSTPKNMPVSGAAAYSTLWIKNW